MGRLVHAQALLDAGVTVAALTHTLPNRIRWPVTPIFAAEAVRWGVASDKGALVARVVWGWSVGCERSSVLRCDRQASLFPGAVRPRARRWRAWVGGFTHAENLIMEGTDMGNTFPGRRPTGGKSLHDRRRPADQSGVLPKPEAFPRRGKSAPAGGGRCTTHAGTAIRGTVSSRLESRCQEAPTECRERRKPSCLGSGRTRSRSVVPLDFVFLRPQGRVAFAVRCLGQACGLARLLKRSYPRKVLLPR